MFCAGDTVSGATRVNGNGPTGRAPGTILVTGAGGYLGSHTCVSLLSQGYSVIGIDNFCNSNRAVLRRIATIAGRPIRCCEGDVRDGDLLRAIFGHMPIDAVVHFAGLKAVAESSKKAIDYYQTNVAGTLSVLTAMKHAGVRRIVFSSSATVYGEPDQSPVAEDAQLRPSNPYGRSKLMAEQILADAAASSPDWSVVLLRYFNPVGAHPSGLLGEDPTGIPNNLMPFISQVAIGRRARLDIFGSDYATPDGTGVRDYIHVMDLARGHVSALSACIRLAGCRTCNLGTGRGYSVLELVEEFRKVSGHRIPVRFAPRRPGDVATTYADVRRAHSMLGWSPSASLHDMCRDTWNWQLRNPDGYTVTPVSVRAPVATPAARVREDRHLPGVF